MNIWLGPVAPPTDEWEWITSAPALALSKVRDADYLALAWDTGMEGVTGYDCVRIFQNQFAWTQKGYIIYESDPERADKIEEAIRQYFPEESRTIERVDLSKIEV